MAHRYIPAHQIAYAAFQAGMRGSQLTTAVAVALGESDGDANGFYHNLTTDDKSYGLWQINMLGDLLYVRLRQFNISHADELFDPLVNARAMKFVFDESVSWGYDGWRPWGAYTNGRYRTAGRWEKAVEGVAVLNERLRDSGDRLHLGGEPDCDSI
jgi:hypothetical protein